MAEKNVLGKVVSATEAGFAELISRANDVYPSGLTLVGVVSIDRGAKIGGVFVRFPKPASSAAAPSPRSAGSLIDE